MGETPSVLSYPACASRSRSAPLPALESASPPRANLVSIVVFVPAVLGAPQHKVHICGLEQLGHRLDRT